MMDIKSAENRLQSLVEEERIIKSLLQQVKSKYLNLQVEHMALSKTQKTVLSKYNECVRYSSSQNISVEEVNQPNEEIQSDSESHNVETEFIKEVSDMSFDDNEISEVNRHLALSTVYREEDLDDPVVINQLKLNNIQTTSQYSESESSDENITE